MRWSGVESGIRHHVSDARPYAGSAMPFGMTSNCQWSLAADATANGVKLRPLGLSGGATG